MLKFTMMSYRIILSLLALLGLRTAVFQPGVYPKLSKFGIIGLSCQFSYRAMTVSVEVVDDPLQAQRYVFAGLNWISRELLKNMSKNKTPTGR